MKQGIPTNEFVPDKSDGFLSMQNAQSEGCEQQAPEERLCMGEVWWASAADTPAFPSTSS